MLPEDLKQRLVASPEKIVHIVVIGTKPDIIKQAPLIHELSRENKLFLVCHTGQHYDYASSEGALNEFDLKVDINLEIKADTLPEKLAGIAEKFGALISEIVALGKTPVPYVHGDTLTASAAALGSAYSRVPLAHVEAGLRTLSPRSEIFKKHLLDFNSGAFSFENYCADLKNRDNYEIGSFEPYPEQIDTRLVDQISGFKFAPVELNRDMLINEQQGSDKNIYVVGNTIADAVAESLARGSDLTVPFDDYLLFSVHRRETCEDETRFRMIYDAIQNLTNSGNRAIIIKLAMFVQAMDKFLSEAEKNELKNNKNILLLDPLARHSDFLKLMQNARLVVADSGGIQEEATVMGVKQVTLRFGSDRPETLFSGHNILAPLIGKDFIRTIIENSLTVENPKAPLYGENVSAKMLALVDAHFAPSRIFLSEEQKFFGA
ncbi:UDP-N-acetylglucosamine 2-epimerase [Candidatus Saccharibacteria bacterium]|nr:UDP-N-acetylglucosamine 2-epimerase [Candidatus Saccharibacteria bacterium]